MPAVGRDTVLDRLADILCRLELPARVAVDGPDTAGKTTLADELAGLLRKRGRTTSRIRADDFLRPPAERYRLGRDSPEGYFLDSFDHAAIRRAALAADGLVLVDGIFLFRLELDDLWDFRILVEIDPEESVRRGTRRDAPRYGSLADAEALYRTRYLPGRRLYEEAASPRRRADAVVDNRNPARPRLVLRGGDQPGAA